MSAFRHPNLVSILGHASSGDGQYGYLVMELLDGCSLFDYLYPTAFLVVGSDSQLEQATRATSATQKHVLNTARLLNSIGGFGSIIMKPPLVYSGHGKTWLKMARFGSRLAARSPDWASTPDPPPLDEHTVALVICIGPYVYSFSVPSSVLRHDEGDECDVPGSKLFSTVEGVLRTMSMPRCVLLVVAHTVLYPYQNSLGVVGSIRIV